MTVMRRMPIRLRLALTVTIGAALLLTVVGVFAYARLAQGLSQDLDRELRQRAQDLIGPVSRSDSHLSELTGTGFVEQGESFAEVMTPTGRVVAATTTLKDEPLLSPAEAARAARGTFTVDRSSAPGLDEPARVLAAPFTRSQRQLVLVVGDTRENGLEVLRRVRTQLMVGIPVLVLVAFGGAWVVATAALRPVEQMRRRAAGLTGRETSLRLPVPDRQDEISRLGATLNDLLARIEQTLDRERRFVAHASHELRAPLALLRTELELAVRRPRPTAELSEAIESAKGEVSRLEHLTDNLLVLAQVGASPSSYHAEEVNLADLLDRVSSRAAGSAHDEGRTIQIDAVGAGVGTVHADRVLLEQALGNLVENAMRHGAGTIRLSTRRERGDVIFTVSDDGPGIDPDLLPHATEPFARGHASTGAGLGLSIVAAVAAAHGGSCGVGDRSSGAESWIAVPVTTGLSGSKL